MIYSNFVMNTSFKADLLVILCTDEVCDSDYIDLSYTTYPLCPAHYTNYSSHCSL